MNLLKKQKQSPKPQINVDITEFRKMQNLKQELDKQVQIIKRIENKELPELLQHSDNLKGKFKAKEKKKVDKQIEVMQDRLADMKSYLPKLVSRHGYKNVQCFIEVYLQSEKAVQQYQKELEEWKENNGLKQPEPESIRAKLRRLEREARERNSVVLNQLRREKEKNRNER